MSSHQRRHMTPLSPDAPNRLHHRQHLDPKAGARRAVAAVAGNSCASPPPPANRPLPAAATAATAMRRTPSASAASSHWCKLHRVPWSQCECKQPPIDDAERRRRLQELHAKTPHGRHEFANKVEAIARDHREALELCFWEFTNDIAAIWLYARLLRDVVECEEDELAERRLLWGERRRSLRELQLHLHRGLELLDVVGEEREWRSVCEAAEDTARLAIEQRCFRGQRLFNTWLDAEHHRAMIESSESQQRAAMWTACQRGAAVLTHAGRERVELWDAQCERRENITQRESHGRQDLCNWFVDALDMLTAFADEREEAQVLQENDFRELCEEEGVAFQLLLDDELEERRAEEMRHHALVQAVADLERHYADSLLALRQREVARRERIADTMAEDRAVADDITRAKQQQREDALEYVIGLFDAIADDERNRFSRIRARFDEELELRHEWVAARAHEREAFLREAWEILRATYKIARREYSFMRQQMEEEAELRQQWIVRKRERRQQLLNKAREGSKQMWAVEEDARAAIYERMDAEHAALVQWLEELGCEQNEAVSQEMLERRELEAAEDTARDALRGWFEGAADDIAAFAAALDDERTTFATRLLAKLREITFEEDQQFGALLALADQNFEAAAALVCVREHTEFDECERAQRRVVVETEVVERNVIVAHLEREEQQRTRRYRDMWAALYLELEHEQQRHRELCAAAAVDGFTALACTERSARAVAATAAAEREARDRLAVQRDLEEDERLYTEEELLTEGRASLVRVRRSVSCRELGLGPSDGLLPPACEFALERCFVEERLGAGINLGGVSGDALTAVAALLERSVAAAEDAKRRALAAASRSEAAAKEEARVVATLAHLKELEQKYAALNESDASEFSARRARERATHDRAVADFHAEQRRLRDAQSKLREQRARVDRLRDKVTAAMMGRRR